MRFKGLLRLCGAAGALAAAAWGGVIKDPQMGLDSDGFSDPLTRSSIFSPNNGGGIFQFYNATGSQIIGLTFETDILPGRILEPVRGDAEGQNFARYLIEVRDPGLTQLAALPFFDHARGDPRFRALLAKMNLA